MLHFIFSIPCVYLLFRFVVPLPWPLGLRIALGLLLIVASQHHLWSRLSSGSVFDPEFPRGLVMAFNWGFGAILLLAAALVVADLTCLAVSRFGPMPIAVTTGTRYALGGITALMAAYGVQQATRLPPVRDIEVAIRDLPPAFEGYQIVQLTDLHLSRLFPQRFARAVVGTTNGLKPDLTVVTGDFIDGTVARRRRDIAPLRDLRAGDGVYFIPGNHEYFFGYAEWMRHLSQMGMRALPNTHTVLRRPGAKIVLAGVTDLSAPDTGDAPPDLAAALAGAPAGAPIILLDHQPKRAEAAAARGVALQLSGHTHGGMIVGLDRIIALANGGFVSGRYSVGAMTLYVNNGTALWPGFALRLGRPAELTRITLRRAVRRAEAIATSSMSGG